ncbi:hypothetical protein ARMGADRAFT_335558 [Armillaria gallica]|uniref:Uncharacterized protein n=1 Tax=Armillaria gallica TaxID=47427 RepID=A0A2H3D1R4_ARMGA|nr:hypothetical protein ARMGADRAFT_335558 [Armillaria gallica]
MDQTATTLALHLTDRLQPTPSNDQRLVGTCRIPESGESVFSDLLERYTNELLEKLRQQSRTLFVGLDGWHLTHAQLDEFPDPILAHSRRRIHWTFDAPAYLAFVNSLRAPLDASPVITTPSFDHAVTIQPHHRIVIIGGLYTCFSGQRRAVCLMNIERCYLRSDIEEAKQKLVKCHVLTRITQTLDDAHLRAEQNDIQRVIEYMLESTRIIEKH